MLKGILEGCILKLVSAQPRYSQELVRCLKECGFENMSEGTLFPLLLRLEKDGDFETERMANPLGPSRKYYSLSAAGREELRSFQQTWEDFSAVVDHILNDEVGTDEQHN